MNELSLAAGVLPEYDAITVAETAGAAGYTCAGFTVAPDVWDSAMTRKVRERVRAHGLSVLDVEPVWIPAGGTLDDGHKLIIDVGAELAARNVLVVSSEPDVARNAAALHQLCEWAAPANIRVALEFLMITEVRSLSKAWSIVERCDHPSAAILIDTLHLQRAGEGYAELAKLDKNLFPYAQLCDGFAGCAENHEAYLEDALDLRSAAGEGELPLREILELLPHNCPLSLEVRSKRYRDEFPDPTARATSILAKTREFMARTNAS